MIIQFNNTVPLISPHKTVLFLQGMSAGSSWPVCLQIDPPIVVLAHSVPLGA